MLFKELAKIKRIIAAADRFCDFVHGKLRRSNEKEFCFIDTQFI